MRRKDREVATPEDIFKILDKCKVLRLAMTDGDMPYLVPLNFGCTFEKGVLELVFHCALTGRKTDLLKKNPRVAFEADTSHCLTEGDIACDYGYLFESVVGFGTAVLLNETSEKISALNILMKHQTGREFTFSEKDVSSVAVYRIMADSFTGKARLS